MTDEDPNVQSAALLEAGEYECAHKAIQRASESAQTIEDKLYADGNRAMWLFLTEKYEEAIAASTDLLGPMIAALGVTDVDVINIEYCRAVSFARLGKYTMAEKMLRGVIDSLALASTPARKPTEDLISVLALQKMYEAACLLAVTHYTECLNAEGHDHSDTLAAIDVLVRVHCASAETLALYGFPESALSTIELAHRTAIEHAHRCEFELGLEPTTHHARLTARLLAKIKKACLSNQKNL